ncbi:MAG: hypothetical protein NC299_15575 [Lachnospiraceae bacterium]|nr:hypothetical protein [Ruminococcus sp.]MCM1276754.1 hypothetical protein [Lachnospiraceae bacterium]
MGAIELPTIYPDGAETVYKKRAIEYRNRFMVNECDTVICYITHNWGGAAKFVSQAEKQGKAIINLAL